MVQDVSYSSGAIRRYLRRRGIRLTIPRKDNEKHGGKFDQAIYRTRNVVERCFNRSLVSPHCDSLREKCGETTKPC